MAIMSRFKLKQWSEPLCAAYYTVAFLVRPSVAFNSGIAGVEPLSRQDASCERQRNDLACKWLEIRIEGAEARRRTKEEGRTAANNPNSRTPCEWIINYRRFRFALREASNKGGRVARAREGWPPGWPRVLFRRSLITEQSAPGTRPGRAEARRYWRYLQFILLLCGPDPIVLARLLTMTSLRGLFARVDL